MKRITKIKIALDIVMMIVLALMYSKMAINLAFHEIGGLAVIGAFVIHKALNFKWIVGVTKKLTSKNTPARTKAMYIVDALMLVCFLIIGVSGVLISKKVFHFEMKGMIYKTLHYTTSALALMLIGVHLGLHATYLGGVFKKFIKKPGRALKPVCVILLTAFVAFGGYNIATTNFASWLSMPFRSMEMTGGERTAPPEGFDLESIGENAQDAPSDETAEGEAGGETERRMNKRRGEENTNPFNALLVFAQYFSIAMVFAVITWAAEKLVRRPKRAKTSEAR